MNRLLNKRRRTATQVDPRVLKTPAEIEKMRAAGILARKVIETIMVEACAGMTTGDIEDRAAEIIAAGGGTSPCLGYAPPGHPPYPAWTCTSVNEEIVHAIPGQKKLQNGDLFTMDCCVTLDGFVADTAVTIPIGVVTPEAQHLLKITEEALTIGIKQAKPGNTTGDIGWAIQKHAEANGLSVVRELHGHGIGRAMHEGAIDVPNYAMPGTGILLVPGMTFAIEPMFNLGTKQIRTLKDGWTIVTADGKLSAHFEHTIAITASGCRILTGAQNSSAL